MLQYMKHLLSINLIVLAHEIVGKFVTSNQTDINREFEQVFKWKQLEKGFKEAEISKKPIFLFLHKLTCPACQNLKAKVTKSMRLIELSHQFVMINVELSKTRIGDQPKYQPDGKYVPRILFFAPNGEFIKEAYNQHQNTEENRYFYSSSAQVIKTMIFVLNKYSDKTVKADVSRGIIYEDEFEDEELIPPTLTE